MNRIDQLFKRKKNILSIYFTAGYPTLSDTQQIIKNLQNSGVDLLEIGLSFSDPLADGPTIQKSSEVALKNGMTTELLFSQLKDIRTNVEIPLIIMGYLNPIVQFGVKEFCARCQKVGIDGLIIPDLPLEIYQKEYQQLFEQYGLYNVFLITPQTNESRIRQLDEASKGFIYMVSSSSITGAKGQFGSDHIAYFDRVSKMNLHNPVLTGFGISNNQTFSDACRYSEGAIIGSAYINHLTEYGVGKENEFVEKIKKP